MVENNDLLRHRTGKAVQEVAKPGGPEGPKGRQWGEGIRQNRLRRKPADAPGRGCQAVRIGIEQRNRWLGNRPLRLVKEVAGANSDIEMAIGYVAIVEPAQLCGRAAPQEAIRKPVHKPIVGPQDKRRKDSMP